MFTTVASATIPDLSGISVLSDDEVMDLQKTLAITRRAVDVASATVAGEIARRSDRELGYAGLAQRTGSRTAEKLVQRLTSSTAADARALVGIGEMLGGSSPWLSSVVGAVERGELSIPSAFALQGALGTPSPTVAADDLLDAAERLLGASAGLLPEEIAAAARAIRDELDAAGIADREAALRGRRYLRLIPQADGMTRIVGLLDPESAALVSDAVDCVTSPRRGGPRFVDPAARETSDRLLRDPRTLEQLAVDALVELVRIAAAADSAKLLGGRAPSVRVHVTLADLDRRAGRAHLEGQAATVSVETTERLACATGIVPILFDESGQAMDVGRDQRLFTARQRIALTARDGGCCGPGCDRPPSWCEAHHINGWDETRVTEVRDGILLCRYHHLLVHNNGWQVIREGADYFLIPPASEDPGRTPRAMQKRKMAG